MPVTFVTAFLHLFEDRSNLRSPSTHIQHFHTIASTGIPIYLFISNMFRDDYERICGGLTNVHVEYMELYEFEAYKAIEDLHVNLPSQRNGMKDTKNFLVLMNTKLECLHLAMESPSLKSSHYAWIDFGIKHVLTDASLSRLIDISNTNFGCILAMPGCWAKTPVFFDKIHWRFCGGFFVGDKVLLEAFYQASKALWESTCMSYCLTWEVNYWAYLEERGMIHPIWYPGDHNDSILDVPRSLYDS